MQEVHSELWTVEFVDIDEFEALQLLIQVKIWLKHLQLFEPLELLVERNAVDTNSTGIDITPAMLQEH